jgi:membrane associated rhomboid family serine protease
MKKALIIVVSSVLFAGLGYLYYQLVGCNGTCAIASSPYNSSIFGAAFGALLGVTVIDWRKKKNADL